MEYYTFENNLKIPMGSRQYSVGWSLLGIFLHSLFFIFVYITHLELITLTINGFVMLLALLLVSIGYLMLERPNKTCHVPWKQYLLVLTVMIILLFVFISNRFDLKWLIFILAFQGLLSLTGWFLIFINFPRHHIIHDSVNKTLYSIRDYYTQVATDQINLEQVKSVEIRVSTMSYFVSVRFYDQKEFSESDNPIKIWTWTRLANVAPFYYKLIHIFSHYSIFIVTEGSVELSQWKKLRNRPFKSTSASFPSHNIVTVIDQIIGKNVNPNFFAKINELPLNVSIDQYKPLKTKFDIESHQDVYILRTKKRGNINILGKIFITTVLLFFICVLALLIILTLYIISNGSTLPDGAFSTSPQKIGIIGIFSIFMIISLISLLFGYFFLTDVICRKYIEFGGEFIYISNKVFQKEITSLIIPKKALLNIEKSKQTYYLRFMGGDSIKLWKTPPNDHLAGFQILRQFLQLDMKNPDLKTRLLLYN
ncbi:MAG: hypothetical protein JSW11_15770 [Candidatus Heimdallarchaeota archaeon]|nr:MAG: hypothetical protein JSW11_15770 [Candidatus Heimdallarchaeota archaeon]